ncbi:hypothetical protein BLNAU_24287 [Blattamonas nauphoetae]|uniref:Uncharacterized protein n=1 Tax=Blattamonas nauphoetae TaxID=2049346 RepID=A0ABQ9WMU3_9EUKA|nr:hypothetical protein BLNAU_24287 [Blattamonas nauphoetae]
MEELSQSDPQVALNREIITGLFQDFSSDDKDKITPAITLLDDLIDFDVPQKDLLVRVAVFTSLGGLQKCLQYATQTENLELRVRALRIIASSTSVTGNNITVLFDNNIWDVMFPLFAAHHNETLFRAWQITNNLIVERHSEVPVLIQKGIFTKLNEACEYLISECTPIPVPGVGLIKRQIIPGPAPRCVLRCARPFIMEDPDKGGQILIPHLAKFLQTEEASIHNLCFELLIILAQTFPANRQRILSHQVPFLALGSSITLRQTELIRIALVTVSDAQGVISRSYPIACVADVMAQRRRLMKIRKGETGVVHLNEEEQSVRKSAFDTMIDAGKVIQHFFAMMDTLAEGNENFSTEIPYSLIISATIGAVTNLHSTIEEDPDVAAKPIIDKLICAVDNNNTKAKELVFKPLICPEDDGSDLRPEEKMFDSLSLAMSQAKSPPARGVTRQVISAAFGLIIRFLNQLIQIPSQATIFVTRFSAAESDLDLSVFVKIMLLMLTICDTDECQSFFEYLTNLSHATPIDWDAFAQSNIIIAVMRPGEASKTDKTKVEFHTAAMDLLIRVLECVIHVRSTAYEAPLTDSQTKNLEAVRAQLTEHKVKEYAQQFITPEGHPLKEMAERFVQLIDTVNS